MKSKTYSTTEFYKKPSEALSFVKDGGIVYLGYKKMKDPIAVLTNIKDYTDTKAQLNTNEKAQDFLEKIKRYQYSNPKCKDSAKYIREQRDKEWRNLF